MSESIEHIREKASAIVARMQADHEFKKQVEQNPESTLVSAGLPAEAVLDFIEESQLEAGDVQVYVVGGGGGCTATCSLSCVITSCFLTL